MIHNAKKLNRTTVQILFLKQNKSKSFTSVANYIIQLTCHFRVPSLLNIVLILLKSINIKIQGKETERKRTVISTEIWTVVTDNYNSNNNNVCLVFFNLARQLV